MTYYWTPNRKNTPFSLLGCTHFVPLTAPGLILDRNFGFRREDVHGFLAVFTGKLHSALKVIFREQFHAFVVVVSGLLVLPAAHIAVVGIGVGGDIVDVTVFPHPLCLCLRHGNALLGLFHSMNIHCKALRVAPAHREDAVTDSGGSADHIGV